MKRFRFALPTLILTAALVLPQSAHAQFNEVGSIDFPTSATGEAQQHRNLCEGEQSWRISFAMLNHIKACLGILKESGLRAEGMIHLKRGLSGRFFVGGNN